MDHSSQTSSSLSVTNNIKEPKSSSGRAKKHVSSDSASSSSSSSKESATSKNFEVPKTGSTNESEPIIVSKKKNEEPVSQKKNRTKRNDRVQSSSLPGVPVDNLTRSKSSGNLEVLISKDSPRDNPPSSTRTKQKKRKEKTESLEPMPSARVNAMKKRGSSRSLLQDQKSSMKDIKISLKIEETTRVIQVERAHDILLLNSLALGAPDWVSWCQCSPVQMWHYFPLFIRVFPSKQQGLPEQFYQAIKPLFHHPDDESIRQLTYWMSRCEMLPADSKQIFGDPEEDQIETAKFFDKLDTKVLKAGHKHTFSAKTCDPVFGVPSPLTELNVVKLFKAHTRPALCEVIYKNSEKYPNRRFIYKEGDDLRDDMYTQIMFFVFNQIWIHTGMARKPFIHLYRVFPTAADKGFVEFVPSTTIQTYNWENLTKFSDKEKEEFICSAAGAFAGAFILGIRDRHRDNMMISDKGHFFHIDFGYMFNNKTWFDANRFAIPSEIRLQLPSMWDGFLELIGESYRMLRRNRGMISYFVTKLFGGEQKLQGLKKYKEPQIIKCLSGAFYDTLTEDEAVLHVRDIASKGEASPKKAIKDLVHRIESKKKKI